MTNKLGNFKSIFVITVKTIIKFQEQGFKKEGEKNKTGLELEPFKNHESLHKLLGINCFELLTPQFLQKLTYRTDENTSSKKKMPRSRQREGYS